MRIRSQFARLLAVMAGLVPGMAPAYGPGLPAVSFAAGGTGLTAFYVLGFELGPWQEYLAQELTPDYLLDNAAPPVRVSWLRSSDVSLLPDFARYLEPGAGTKFHFDFQFESSGEFLAPDNRPEPQFQGSLFERQYFSPGLEQQVNEGGVLGVAAVIAHQRFSAASLGLLSATTPESEWLPRATVHDPYGENGYGTGVRLTLRQELYDRFALETGYQSRIDMEEFARYRGVYSDPADLDIPARARVGLAFRATEHSWFRVTAERVMYSDINAFPSRFLPNRFLSLLGDSTSPSFEWQDQTVYTVGWNWDDGEDQRWHVELSSRQQPSPTSRILRQAIEDELADSALVLGYSRRTGKNQRLNLNAAYAPSEFAFGGSVLGVTTEELGQRFEFEALWTMNF